MGRYYRIKIRPTATVIAGAKYGYRRFEKGRTYSILRKLTPTQAKIVRNRKEWGYKVLSLRRTK